VQIADTALPTQIIWIILGMIGAIATGIMALQAVATHRMLIRREINGARRIAAIINLIVQCELLVVQIIVIVTGGVSALIPAANPDITVSLPLIIVTFGIGGMEVVLVAVSLTGLAGWNALDQYLKGQERQERQEQDEATELASQHAETMVELVHNTEVSTEARDGALESLHQASEANVMAAERNRVAGESAEALHEYMKKLEGERQDREDC